MQEDDLRVCLRVLAELAEAPHDDPDLVRVQQAVSAFTKRTRQNARAAERRRRVAEDAAALASPRPGPRTEAHAVVPLQEGRAEYPPAAGRWSPVGSGDKVRRCYMCKSHFLGAGRLCPPCDAENRAHRHARADLTGRRAVVTGGRVKAGFELVLKLLRDGAEVTAITRFPHDARRRFAAVPDSPDWAARLTVTGMDLRDVPTLLRWCDAQVEAGRPLDILVNLAAQTVRPPAQSYAALLAAERAAELTAGPATVLTMELAAADRDGLIPDLSPDNSWTRLVEDVDPVEFLEVQLINVTAPFLLLGRLRPLLESSPHPRRYVVNVSAAEGQFDRRYKSPGHPHTNMAKAALNMLTRTSADELATHAVYMTSVDPGWFSDQQPEPDRRRRAAAGFRPPLDDVDAAARVYHPIVCGERGDPPYGCLLKDYRVAPW
ncbi:NAD(P)-dependent dehydrogenase, short-chain alcohol dehydrogenase family [Nonomuraea maritima]|uniref:NAD(P)-dependent dehydrogenase, short-chain alcohol dehydrogenase family n=1 Tax=Nonomuraea maritima TaxID=683260 RepID=A0A1G9AA01_9ACTN|nr:SDR family oxidoreductase [Nonomuraea maritima]SDK23280.1 NAD(P)-dependent dehydrogenase, short-chain alcohol dehydrogenase family [Nonomuraea maritima]